MPFLENLVQGLSEAAGNDSAVERIQKNKDDRRATQQEELHGRTKAILDDVAILQERRSKLPPGSPEIAEIDKALREHQQAFTDLYHPTKNPGAMQHLGGFLKQHLTGKAPAPAPKSNAVTAERMAGLQASAAGTQPADPYLTPDELRKKARIAAGLEPKAVADRPESENWIPTTVKLADGREVTFQRNSKDGRWTDLAGKEVPAEVLSTASIVPKQTGKKRYAWKKMPNGQFASVELDDKNQIVPGTENTEIQPPSSIVGSITTGDYHFQDDKGNVHQVEETHRRMPANNSSPSVPKTAGEAKNKAASTAPKSSGDRILGHKDTPVQSKARKDYTDAVKLASIADQVEKNPNDAVNQKRLAVALERISAGRFTTQALDYIVKAGWGNTIEGWANSTTTGALPKDVMRQLIDGAHENLKASQDALKQSLQGAVGQDSDDDEFLKKF